MGLRAKKLNPRGGGGGRRQNHKEGENNVVDDKYPDEGGVDRKISNLYRL